MVVAEILGVVNDVTPVPPVSTEPPVAAAYQSIVSPAETDAEMLTIPVPQREPFVAVGAVGNGFTTTLAVAVVEQPAELEAVSV